MPVQVPGAWAAVAVALKETAVRPGAVAEKPWAPTVAPRVAPMEASPAASVVTVPLSRLPPPETTAKVTGTPETGSASLPSTRTTSGCASRVPTVAVWPSPLTRTSAAGAATTYTNVVSANPLGVFTTTWRVSRVAGVVRLPAGSMLAPVGGLTRLHEA